MTTRVPRAEVLGSLLRPQTLKDARAAWVAGDLTTAQFKRIEDRAVDEMIALQTEAGVDVLTDGEMRRGHFAGPLVEAVDGISAVAAPRQRYYGSDAQDTVEHARSRCVTGRLVQRRSLATEEFVYLRRRTDVPIKVTLPSPLTMAFFWSPEHSKADYADPFDLFADAALILKHEVTAVQELGAEYIQIDAPELGTLVDERQRERWESLGISPDRLLSEGVSLVDSVVEGSSGMTGLHLCRGNLEGRWHSAGGYDGIVREVLGQAKSFDAFLLEYDDSRSGGFEPLRLCPTDRRVVLGLVSTKTSRVEDVSSLVMRVEEASRYFPLDQLSISPQCGFGSTLAGNPVGQRAQAEKLRLVSEVAREVWGQRDS